MVRITSGGWVPGLYWCKNCDTWAYKDRSEARQAIKRMHATGLSPYQCPIQNVFHAGPPSR